MFLAHVSAARLPFVYVGIALVAYLIHGANERIVGRYVSRRSLAVMLLTSGVLTTGFYFALSSVGTAAFYALYIWSGAVTTLVVIHLWMLLDRMFTITQAKRVYGLVGSGAASGAIAGALVASLLTNWMNTSGLLLVSGLGFCLAAPLPRFLNHPRRDSVESASPSDPGGGAIAQIWDQPYARGLAALALCSAACLTLLDYVFKHAVANSVSNAELGQFFALTSLALNLASLLIQVLCVGPLLRRFSLTSALVILPACIVVGGVGMIVAGGLIAALALKLPDGTLRHSLHRTSTELLFVPFSNAVRNSVKPLIDSVFQRGGQALASMGLLALLALDTSAQVISGAMLLLAAIWIYGAVRLRSHYLDLFRSQLRWGEIGGGDFPDLDAGSLETLIAALDSDNPDRTLAAMGILHREGKTRLIPALVLYHPHEQVVELALRLFASTKRRSALPAIQRVLHSDHRSASTRAAAVTAHSVIDFDAALLESLQIADSAPEVQGAARVNLIVAEKSRRERQAALEEVLRSGDEQTKAALADVVRWRRRRGFTDALERLAEDPSPTVRKAASKAMGVVRHPRALGVLIALLQHYETREYATQALVRYGEDARRLLGRTLSDPSTPTRLRAQLPAALSRFHASPEAAAEVLCRQLLDDESGTVRYRILFALEQLQRAHENLELDSSMLTYAVERDLSRAFRYLERRQILSRGIAESEARRTPGGELLVQAVADKCEHAVERVFRLLNLLHPGERLMVIHTAAKGEDEKAKAGALELLSELIDEPIRTAVVALLSETDDRLELGRSYHEPLERDYEQLLRELLESTSRALRDCHQRHDPHKHIVHRRHEVIVVGCIRR